ncbi:uncharacterized protein LOC144448642 [Glandiceps talaboti]
MIDAMSSKHLFNLSKYCTEFKCIIASSAIRHHSLASKHVRHVFSQQTRNLAATCRHVVHLPHSNARIFVVHHTVITELNISHDRTHTSEGEGVGHFTKRFFGTSQSQYEQQTSRVTVKSGGSTFDAVYGDSGKRDGPVVVCLHGAPASHKDFTSIAPSLVAAGVRLITPNFPGYGNCTEIEGNSYSYTQVEKSRFLQDFLTSIGINRVTVLLAFSASGATASQLCADADFMDSVVFISGINIRPHRRARPKHVVRSLSLILEHIPLIRKRLLPIIVRLSGFRISDPIYMMHALHEVRRINWSNCRHNVEMLGKSELPVMVIGVENDPFVEAAIAREKMDILGIHQDDDVLYFNADGVCTQGNIEDHKTKPRRGAIFEKGGHFIQNAFPDQITKLILDMTHTSEGVGHFTKRFFGTSQSQYEQQTSRVTVESGGSTYDVVYGDCGKRDGPVVVCLHGAPASHKDFTSIAPSLVAAGVRLITPNFPGYGNCTEIEGNSYSYTQVEKSRFLQDFLASIGINRVTVLVAHSASGATASQLCADADFMDSVVYISGVNIRPHRYARPKYVIRTVSYLTENVPILRKIITQLAVRKSGFRVSDPLYMLGVIHEVGKINWSKCRHNVEMLGKSELPVMVIGVENDPIVEVAIGREKMDILGIHQDDDVLYFNADGVCTQGNIEDHKTKPRRGAIFEKGGHFIQNAFPDHITKLILDMVQLVIK